MRLAGAQRRAAGRPSPRRGGTAWCHIRPGIGRVRGRWARRRTPFVPRLGGAASPNLRAFGPPLSPIQLVTRVKLGAQHHQHHRKPSLAAPAAVAVVNARYGPERSAMARHGAPDRSVQNSPFSARR